MGGVYVVPADGDRVPFSWDGTVWASMSGTGVSLTSDTQLAMAAPADNPNTVMLATSSASVPSGTKLAVSPGHGVAGTWAAPTRIFASRLTNTIGVLQLVAKDSSNLYCWNGDSLTDDAGIWRSTDGGAAWTRVVTHAAGFVGGWMAVASAKMFWTQRTVAYPPPAGSSWGQWTVVRAGLDGGSQETLATIPVGPRNRGAGSVGVLVPTSVLNLRPLSDSATLVVGYLGSTSLGVDFLASTTFVVDSPTFTLLGSERTIAPYKWTAGRWSVSFRVHHDSATLTGTGFVGQYQLQYQYQNDDLTWSAQIDIGSIQALTAGEDWIANHLSVPAGARAYRFWMKRNSNANFQINGWRISEAYEHGLLLRVGADGTVADVRPPAMLRPWDVLPLTASRWIAAGVATLDSDVPRDVLVMRTDDAGSSWTLLATIAAAQGFNASTDQTVPDYNDLLVTRTPGSTTELAMSGAASDTTWQIVWVSDDAGATWTQRLNTAHVPGTGTIHAPTGLLWGPAPPPTAIPGRLATIVG